MQIRLEGTALKRLRKLKEALHRDGFPVSFSALVNDLVSKKAKERLDQRKPNPNWTTPNKFAIE